VHGENEYDEHPDTPNRTNPFEKYDVTFENKDAELNHTPTNWEW
jgi:hypothetical protein